MASYPGQEPVSCGDLQTAGFEGRIPLDQCAYLPMMLRYICDCSTSLTPPTTVECAAIANGTATTDAPMVQFQVFFNITISNDNEIETVTSAIQPLLQRYVAPAVAGCPNATEESGNRRLQQSTEETTIVNVVFQPTEPMPEGEYRVNSMCLEPARMLLLLVPH